MVTDDEAQVRQTLHRFLRHLDEREYDAAAGLLTDPVRFDYRALSGDFLPGDPAALVARVRADHRLLDGVQHIVTNHVVELDGDTAGCWVNFIATHAAGDRTWTLGGRYQYRLVRTDQGWKLRECTITPVWQTGDRGIMTGPEDHGSAGSPAAAAP